MLDYMFVENIGLFYKGYLANLYPLCMGNHN